MLGTLTLDTRPFNADRMSRRSTVDMPPKGVMGRLDPSEFTGEGMGIMTLSGQLQPSKIGGLSELETVDKMRRAGTRFPVMRGDGQPLERRAHNVAVDTTEGGGGQGCALIARRHNCVQVYKCSKQS